MKKHIKKVKKAKEQDYISDYTSLIGNSLNSVIVKTEWEKEGDFFNKFSMYDESYTPIKTLGSTTLIKAL